MTSKSIILLAASLNLVTPFIARGSSIAIGGFDAGRLGSVSFTANTGLQNLIDGQFPGSTFTGTTTLTASYLSTVNALIISDGTGTSSSITPLSISEQAALLNFVLAGGTALLITDNSTFDANAVAANNSFLTPFGLTATGTLSGFQSSTIVNSASPVVSGIAGTASGFDTNFPGWYSSLGSAQVIARLTANNQPDLAILLPGALEVGSGAVIFFADGNNLSGEPAGGAAIVPSLVNDNKLILNSLAFAVPRSVATPEPGTAILVMAGLASAVCVNRRRTRARYR